MSRPPRHEAPFHPLSRAELASTPRPTFGSPLSDKPAQTIPHPPPSFHIIQHQQVTCPHQAIIERINDSDSMRSMFRRNWAPFDGWRCTPQYGGVDHGRGARGAQGKYIYRASLPALKRVESILHFTGGLIDKNSLFWSFGKNCAVRFFAKPDCCAVCFATVLKEPSLTHFRPARALCSRRAYTYNSSRQQSSSSAPHIPNHPPCHENTSSPRPTAWSSTCSTPSLQGTHIWLSMRQIVLCTRSRILPTKSPLYLEAAPATNPHGPGL